MRRVVPVVELWHERRGLGRCRSEGTVDERKLHCDESRDTCTIRAGNGAFSIQCDGPPPYEGAYLLPCGAKAKLVTQGLMGRTESNY